MKNETAPRLKVPFFSKAVLSFLVPLLVSLSILGFFSINSSLRNVRGNAEQAQKASLAQASERIEYILDEMNALTINYSINQRVQYTLKKNLQNEYFPLENWNELSIILNMLSVSQNVRPYLHSIYVYFNNPRKNFITSDLVVTKLENFADKGWFDSAVKKDPSVLEWSEAREIPNSVQPEKPLRLITFYKRIYSYNTKSYAGVVVFNVLESYLSRVLKESASYPNQVLLMQDASGNLVAASAPGASKILAKTGIKKNGYINTSIISRRGYEYHSVTPARELYLLADYFLKMNLVYICVALAAGIALVAYITERSNRQIQGVISIIKSAKTGRLKEHVASEKPAKDSYQAILYNILNTFLEKDYLKVQLSEKLYRERLDELMALQAQINPHFLFNTLQTIHLRAMNLGGAKNDVSEMIENLSLVLRYSMDDPGARVTLREEIIYAKSYLAIQAVRYKKKLLTRWNCDDAALPAQMPKLILQPILENSIHHGIAGETTNINIEVNIEKVGERVIMTVADDGAGMDAARLAEIRQKLGQTEGRFDHIGLLNTNRRLKLMFGEDCSLDISSDPGRGTIVRIDIPT